MQRSAECKAERLAIAAEQTEQTKRSYERGELRGGAKTEEAEWEKREVRALHSHLFHTTPVPPAGCTGRRNRLVRVELATRSLEVERRRRRSVTRTGQSRNHALVYIRPIQGGTEKFGTLFARLITSSDFLSRF